MILEKFKLDGKVAIVTGASRGLGQGIALGLAEAGADICAVSRGDQSATKSRIEGLNRKCLALQQDLSDRKNLKEIPQKD